MNKYVDITDSYKHVLAEVEGHVWEVEIDTDPSYGVTVVSVYLWKDVNIVSHSFIYDPVDKEDLTKCLADISVETSKVLSELPKPHEGTYFCVDPTRKSLSLIDSNSGLKVVTDYSEGDVLLQYQKLIGLLNDKLTRDIDKINKFR